MPVRQLTFKYHGRGAADQLMRNRSGEVLLGGPAGTGKSMACLVKMHMAALKYAGMRGLIMRRTAVSLTSSGLVTYREKVAKEAIRSGIVKWYGGSQQEAACYRYNNGSILNVGGMDNATKIMSTEYDMIYVQEAIELSRNDWESATSRLRNGVMPYQQLIADTNPDAEHHWLYQRCQEGTTVLLESRHVDNPLYAHPDGTLTELGQAYIVGKLQKLTGVRKLRLCDGLWVSAEGQVYEDYDPAVHLVDAFEVPQEWPRYWSVDFGYRNPAVIQWWAQDPDGGLIMYREIYRTGTLVEDLAREALTYCAPAGRWKEPKPQRIICDHDAEDRATLTKHLGLGTTAAVKTVKDGIQAVTARLQLQGNGKPGVRIMRNCTKKPDKALQALAKPASTAEEFSSYIWPPDKKTADQREAPVKENDHGMDAMRYVVMDLDRKGSVRGRWF